MRGLAPDHERGEDGLPSENPPTQLSGTLHPPHTVAAADSPRAQAQLFIKGPFATIVLRVDATSTVADVKRALWQRSGIPPHEQRLAYAGKQLEDVAHLRERGLPDGATLHLLLRLRGGMNAAAPTETPPAASLASTSATPTITTTTAADPPPTAAAAAPSSSPSASSNTAAAPETPPPSPIPAAASQSPATAATATDRPAGSESADSAAQAASAPAPGSADTPPPARVTPAHWLPPGVAFSSGARVWLPDTAYPPLTSAQRLGVVSFAYPAARDGERRLFLASCGQKRIQDTAAAVRMTQGVTSIVGPLISEGAYGCIEVTATAATAAELVTRFNTLWEESGPASLATMTPVRHKDVTWWLRPIIGVGGIPVDKRWQGPWPLALLRELETRGIPPEGVILSKQGKGVWLAGAGEHGAEIAREAAAALRLEGAYRAKPGEALYRLGPIADPSALMPSEAEAALRAMLAAGETRCATDEEETQPLTFSAPEIRSIGGADWYVWLGEGGRCGADGKPLLLNRLFSATYGSLTLYAGIAPASSPGEAPAPNASGPKTFAAAAAAARNVAQPSTRHAPQAKAAPARQPAEPQQATSATAAQAQPTLTAEWQPGRRNRGSRRSPGAAKRTSPQTVSSGSDSDGRQPAQQRPKTSPDSAQTVAPQAASTSGASAPVTQAGPSASPRPQVIAPAAARISPVTRAAPAPAPTAAQPAPSASTPAAVSVTFAIGTAGQTSPPTSSSSAVLHPPPGTAPSPSPATQSGGAASVAPAPVVPGPPSASHAPLAPGQPARTGPTPPSVIAAQSAGPSARAPAPTLRTPSAKRLAQHARGSGAGGRPETRPELERRLKEQGLTLLRTEGDGNCLFRALSDQLSEDRGAGHAAVRQRVVAYMRANAAAYQSLFPDVGAHLDDMAILGTEGDQPEIDAASKAYGRSVVVHVMGGTAGPAFHLRAYDAEPPLQLAFVNGGHYDTVRYRSRDAREDWVDRMLRHGSGDLVVLPSDADSVMASPGPVADSTTATSASGSTPLPTAVTALATPATTTTSAAASGAAAAVKRFRDGGRARVPDGMCAPAAISRGLAVYCGRTATPQEVQQAITGSTAGSAWSPSRFVAAARHFNVVLTFYRNGRTTQSIGPGPCADTLGLPRIFLRVDPHHVDLITSVECDAYDLSRRSRQYVDIHTDGDVDLSSTSLTVLDGVSAASGAGGAAHPTARTGRAAEAVHGLCAATVFVSEALGNFSAEDVQYDIKGSSRPAPWSGDDFLRASRRYGVDIVIHRQGFEPTRFLASPGGDDNNNILGIEISPDGSHAAECDADPSDVAVSYVPVGGALPAMLAGVAACSGRRDLSAAGLAACSGRRPAQAAAGGGATRRQRVASRPPLPPQDGASAGAARMADADPSFGACSGIVPPEAPAIKTLMAALPCNLPAHVEGWMRKQAFHLQRILAAEPAPQDGFATDEARWRYEMAVLGPKMEFELLRHRASQKGMKWAQGLGATLPPVRALLPPLEPAAWRTWDSRPLLGALREAVDFRATAPRAHPEAIDVTTPICSLLEKGRIPAAKAALYGEEVLPHPPPSPDMQRELQAKNPRPESSGATVPAGEWEAAAAECEERCTRIPTRVAANDLLRAAQMQRAGASAGPDGWNGLYLRRAATLFPTEIAELMWREYSSLSLTLDPLLASAVTDATIGGLAKPRGGFRPIVIGRCAVRCMVAHLVRRVRPQLRGLLERGHQYGLTGVLPAVIRPWKMLTKCAAAGVPWALTDDDFSNAFNAVSQRALFEAVRRISAVAPELAACMLRGQCMVRDGGAAEMVMRGRYPPGHAEPFVVERFARGGGQGCPDMPAAFAEVIAMIDVEVEASMSDVRGSMTSDAAARILWPLVQRQAGLSADDAATPSWRDALDRLMAMPRPDPGWGGLRGEASSAYADDTHAGGWAVACVIKSLRRIARAREQASLHADPLKCKVLTSASLKPDLDALLEPLRHGDGDRWQVVTRMRVLGVTLSDPTDRERLEQTIRETLRVRVIAPADRLITEMAADAKPSTAYFALTRFVIPNVLYHMQVWGLLCAESVWDEVDEAFSRFCRALCPQDLRDRLGSSTLRTELSLPQEFGGLGIPRVALEARFRAADQWNRRDAVEAGALPENVAAAYIRGNTLDASLWEAAGMERFYKTAAAALAERLPSAETRDLKWRRERNQLRSALWAFNAVPWVEELALDHSEWGTAWRLSFGGLTAEMRHLLDHPEDGFAFRGRRMEYAVAEAIRECVPPGVVAISAQPAPEHTPLDHVERCRRERISPDGWKRADIAVAFTTGVTFTLDVRTTNTQSASARGAASAEAHLRAQEAAKRAKYRGYYRNFHPFVIDLGGAVTESSYGVLKKITDEAAKASGPRLRWEKHDWAVRVQRRIAVAMVRTATQAATRTPARPPPPDSYAGFGRRGSSSQPPVVGHQPDGG